MDKEFENKKFILASGSPRRVEMMTNAGADFEIIKPGCEENINTKLSPKETVMALALRKALTVIEENKEKIDGKIVIACDTVVVLDNEVIGKPKDETDAFDILKRLSGRSHQVISGVCIYDKYPKVFSSVTDVFFKTYSDQEIKDYIATGEPMDKAGAYAIQGLFAEYIDHIEGLYSNVVGFPIEDIKASLVQSKS